MYKLEITVKSNEELAELIQALSLTRAKIDKLEQIKTKAEPEPVTRVAPFRKGAGFGGLSTAQSIILQCINDEPQTLKELERIINAQANAPINTGYIKKQLSELTIKRLISCTEDQRYMLTSKGASLCAAHRS